MSDLKSFDVNGFLQRLGDGKTVLKLAKNKVIYAQGDPAELVYFIHEGRVKLNVVSKHGKEAVVAILEPGQFFGEGCLNGQTTRIATTSAITDAIVSTITKSAMIAALRNEPKFSEYFIAWLLNRNIRIEEDLIDQLFNFSETPSGPSAVDSCSPISATEAPPRSRSISRSIRRRLPK